MGGTKHTITKKASDCAEYEVYDGHQSYTCDVTGIWWIESTIDTPAVTHTEWYYQTRTVSYTYKFQ